MPRSFIRKLAGPLAAAALLPLAGCYHYSFVQRPRAFVAGPIATGQRTTITFSRQVNTYLAGLVGKGHIDTSIYCRRPLKTELRTTGKDAALSAVTLLVYTPKTLVVTCELPESDP